MRIRSLSKQLWIDTVDAKSFFLFADRMPYLGQQQAGTSAIHHM